MELEITTIYCICEDLLKALCIKEDPQVKMNNAEVMTVALTASMYFAGNYERSREFLAEHGYIPSMLSKSRFNRRLNSIDETTWLALFNLLAEAFNQTNEGKEYIIDSFPVPVCDNIRIYRSKIYQTEEYRGYIASKKRYFYGLRVHLLITNTGRWNSSWLQAQEMIAESSRGSNSLCQREQPYTATKLTMTTITKRVETTASQITALFPKSIHAVTQHGFELKVVLFIIAFAIQCQ